MIKGCCKTKLHDVYFVKEIVEVVKVMAATKKEAKQKAKFIFERRKWTIEDFGKVKLIAREEHNHD